MDWIFIMLRKSNQMFLVGFTILLVALFFLWMFLCQKVKQVILGGFQ